MNRFPKQCGNLFLRNARFSSTTAESKSTLLPKPFSEIPGPKPLPILGNTWRYLVKPLNAGNFIGWQEKLHQEYGDICIVRNQLGVPDMVYIFDTDCIELILRSEGKWPKRFDFFSLRSYKAISNRPAFGSYVGLANSEGEEWYNLRSKINPIFMRPNVMKPYIPVLDQVSTDFLKRMRSFARSNPNGEMPENFLGELNKWAFESLGTIALDTRLGCLDENPSEEVLKMIRYVVEIFKMMFILDFTPFGKYIIKWNLPLWKRFVEYNDYFVDLTIRYINETEERIRTQPKSDHEMSVFEKLLGINKQIAMGSTMDMLGGGIDTTGLSVAAALYYLAKHEEVQNKLREELVQAMPTPDTPITKEILDSVPYLKAVIKECSRLSPIGFSHMRETQKDVVVGGYEIPKGVLTMVPTMYLSRLETHYHRANEFLPERWLKSTTGKLSRKNTKPFVTMPFGHGPRGCIGQRFAQLEMEILLSKVIRNFELRWPHPDMKFGQHLLYGIKDPLRIQIKDVDS